MHSKSCVWQLITQNLAIAFILFVLQKMETIYICNSKILNVQITLGFRSTSYHTIKPYSTEDIRLVAVLLYHPFQSNGFLRFLHKYVSNYRPEYPFRVH